MKSRMNDSENIADYFDEEDFAADEFEAEIVRRDHEEGRAVDAWLDEEQDE